MSWKGNVIPQLSSVATLCVYSANCPIDPIYATYLNVVPLPNGNKLAENGTYFITCKNVHGSYGCLPVNKNNDTTLFDLFQFPLAWWLKNTHYSLERLSSTRSTVLKASKRKMCTTTGTSKSNAVLTAQSTLISSTRHTTGAEVWGNFILF